MPVINSHINELLHHYFDKVLVLSVPRFKDRQERVKKNLAGLSFEFFFGTDKNDLTDAGKCEIYHYDPRNSLSITQTFKPLNDGEIACALSHLNIYKTMLDNNWQRVLILEDDVVPLYANVSSMPDCLGELPPDWELLYLGYLKNENPGLWKKARNLWYQFQASLGLTKLPASMIRNFLPKPFSEHLMHAGFHDCTHAYAITLEGARKLIDIQRPIHYRADNLLSAQVLRGTLKAFISKPVFFDQEIFSDLDHLSHVREKKN